MRRQLNQLNRQRFWRGLDEEGCQTPEQATSCSVLMNMNDSMKNYKVVVNGNYNEVWRCLPEPRRSPCWLRSLERRGKWRVSNSLRGVEKCDDWESSNSSSKSMIEELGDVTERGPLLLTLYMFAQHIGTLIVSAILSVMFEWYREVHTYIETDRQTIRIIHKSAMVNIRGRE